MENHKDNFSELTPEEEESLKNTTAGQFRELSRRIREMGVSCTDAMNAAKLGKMLNMVPPYAEPARQISIFRIIRISCEIMAVASMIAMLIKWMVG